MKKVKWISILLVLALVISVIPMPVSANTENIAQRNIHRGKFRFQGITNDTLYDWGASVLKIGDTYKMWWVRQRNTGGYNGDTIYYAESTNMSDWTAPTFVIGVASPTTWNKNHIADPAVVFVNGTYYMFYESPANYDDTDSNIFMASSTDGVTFSRYPNNNDPQPVIKMPDSLRYQGHYGIGQPSVLYRNGRFEMYYVSSLGGGVDYMKFAYSYDGINWGYGDVFNDSTVHPTVFDRAACGVKYSQAQNKYLLTYTLDTYYFLPGTRTEALYVMESDDGLNFTYSSIYQGAAWNPYRIDDPTVTTYRDYPNFVTNAQGIIESESFYIVIFEGTMAPVGQDWRMYANTWDLVSYLVTPKKSNSDYYRNNLIRGKEPYQITVGGIAKPNTVAQDNRVAYLTDGRYDLNGFWRNLDSKSVTYSGHFIPSDISGETIISFDLGEVKSFDSYSLWSGTKAEQMGIFDGSAVWPGYNKAIKMFDVQASTNGTTWQTIDTVTNNSEIRLTRKLGNVNETNYVMPASSSPVSARYVRWLLRTTGPAEPDYLVYELQLFEAANTSNLASGASISVKNGTTGQVITVSNLSKINDGTPGTLASDRAVISDTVQTNGDCNVEIIYDFGSTKYITDYELWSGISYEQWVIVANAHGNTGVAGEAAQYRANAIKDWKVLVSIDAVNWTLADYGVNSWNKHVSRNIGSLQGIATGTVLNEPKVPAGRYVKFVVTKAFGSGANISTLNINEIKIFGAQDVPCIRRNLIKGMEPYQITVGGVAKNHTVALDYTVEYLTDGSADLNKFWKHLDSKSVTYSGHFTPLDASGETIISFDLGELKSFDSYSLWSGTKAEQMAIFDGSAVWPGYNKAIKMFDVQASTNGTTWQVIDTVTNNSEIRLTRRLGNVAETNYEMSPSSSPVSARYIRWVLRTTGPAEPDYLVYEIQLFESASTGNLAPGASVSVKNGTTGQVITGSVSNISKINDGTPGTLATDRAVISDTVQTNGNCNVEIIYDFGSKKYITDYELWSGISYEQWVIVANAHGNTGVLNEAAQYRANAIKDWKVLVSDDAVNWTLVDYGVNSWNKHVSKNIGSLQDIATGTILKDNKAPAGRYVKFVVTKAFGDGANISTLNINEIKIYGKNFV